MTVSEVDLYNILKKKLGEKEADTLVSFVKEEVTSKFEDQKDFFSSKEDLANVKTELVEKISNFKADIIKWMFIFWVGQLAAVFVILKFLA